MIKVKDTLIFAIFIPMLMAGSSTAAAADGGTGLVLPTRQQPENADAGGPGGPGGGGGPGGPGGPGRPGASLGREILVHVRYSVMANGKPGNVRVIGGLGDYTDGQVNNAILRMVQGWTFTPATLNGEAIDLHNQQQIINLGSGQFGISPEVRDSYEALASQIQNGEHQAVVDRIRGMLGGNLSVFDYAFLNDLLTNAYMGMNLPHEALAASRKATIRIGPVGAAPGAPRTDVLTSELLEGALRKHCLLALSLGQNREALQAYERLMAMSALDEVDALHAQAETARQRINAPDPLGLLAKITEGGAWRYMPGRRILGVTEVKNGDIDELNIHCQRRELELDFQAGVEWNLPPALGECEMEFLGDNGTEFTLYEFAE